MVAVARQPGALNLNQSTLSFDDVIAIFTAGQWSAQTTLAELKELFDLGPSSGGYTLVTSGATYNMTDDDVGVLLLKTVSSATQVNLPVDPPDGFRTFIKYGKDDQDSFNTTIAAGGVLINGATSLVMVAAWQVVNLKFMDDQWWTV
jgi:hypothetical protein